MKLPVLLTLLLAASVVHASDEDASSNCGPEGCELPNAFRDEYSSFLPPLMHMDAHLVLGVVAHDAASFTYGLALRDVLRSGTDISCEVVFYDNYERLVEAVMQGYVHVAHTSALAWVQVDEIVKIQGIRARPMVLRDVDADQQSVIVTTSSSGLKALKDLQGKKLGVGNPDSPASLVGTLHAMDSTDLAAGEDFEVVFFSKDVGLHGRDATAEVAALDALSRGEVDAAAVQPHVLAQAGEGKFVELGKTDKYDAAALVMLDGLTDVHMHLLEKMESALVDADTTSAAFKQLVASGGGKPFKFVKAQHEGINVVSKAATAFKYLAGYLKPYSNFASGFDFDGSELNWGEDDWKDAGADMNYGEHFGEGEGGDEWHAPDLNWETDGEASMDYDSFAEGGDWSEDDFKMPHEMEPGFDGDTPPVHAEDTPTADLDEGLDVDE